MPSLEEALAENTRQLSRVADLLEKGGSVAASTGTTTTAASTGTKDKTNKTATSKPKHTVEQVKAVAMQVKNDIGEQEAKDLIASHAGEGKKLADLANMPAKFDAFVAEAEQMLADAAGGDGDGDI